MRRLVVVAAAAVMVAALAVGTVAGASNLWKAPPFSSIGIRNVYYIGNDFAEGGPDSIVLRVWMETGSRSEACLATVGEANHAVAVDTLYCSSRNVTLADGREHWGVYVTLLLAGPLEGVGVEPNFWTDPSWYSLNVYQEGARFYGDPLRALCDESGCFPA